MQTSRVRYAVLFIHLLERNVMPMDGDTSYETLPVPERPPVIRTIAIRERYVRPARTRYGR